MASLGCGKVLPEALEALVATEQGAENGGIGEQDVSNTRELTSRGQNNGIADILLADSTIFSTLFGGTKVLRTSGRILPRRSEAIRKGEDP